jgi:hypothetical protein
MSGNIIKVLNQPLILTFQPTNVDRERLPGSTSGRRQERRSRLSSQQPNNWRAIFVEGGVNKIAGGPTQARS